MKKRLKRTAAGLLLWAMLLPCLTGGAAAAFHDVPANHWTAPAIARCAELGFFQGETATTFGLGKNMTRAAFVVVLSRFFGWETPTAAVSSYEDVPAGEWYAGAVEAALRNGAITLQTKTFRPEESLTREEMAVMLIRALGYRQLAGLAQELPNHFQDVTTNPGYIALAQELDLVSGTSAMSFGPQQAATREEVAVTLIRVYDKLHAAAPGRVGIITTTQDLPALQGFEAVAIDGGQLISISGRAKLLSPMTAEETAAARAAAKEAGAKQLLYVEAKSNFLDAELYSMAQTLSAAVAAGGYDGLFLHAPEVNSRQSELVRLTTSLRSQLTGKLLYLGVEAPSWHGRTYGGYDYAGLGKQVDRLVLHLPAVEKQRLDDKSAFAPLEPLEEAYYALSVMNNRVDMKKVSLMLSTTADVWSGLKQEEAVAGNTVEALGETHGLARYYSDRYAAPYLAGEADKKPTTVWYLDSRAVTARMKLLSCFGVDQMCFSELGGMSAELLTAWK